MLSVSGIVTTDEEILHAIEHIENDDFQVTLPILSRAVAFQPNNALAYQLWIMCHIHLGRLEKAFELTETDLSHGMPPVMLNIQKTHDVWLARLWAANRPPLQRPEITS